MEGTFSLLIFSNIENNPSRAPLASFMYYTLRILSPPTASLFLAEFYSPSISSSSLLTFRDTHFNKKSVYAFLNRVGLHPEKRPDSLLTSPRAWGPVLWRTLFQAAAAYKPSNYYDFRAMLHALPEIIPCPECAENFRKLLETHPVPTKLNGAKGASAYMSKLHSIVSQHAKK